MIRLPWQGGATDDALKERLWTLDFVMALGVLHFMFAAFTAQFTVIPEYVVHRGGEEWHIGIVIGSLSIATMVSRPFLARWVARVGPRKAGVVSGIMFAASVMLYVPISDVWLLVPVRMLNGICMIVGTIGAFTAVADMAPASRRGEGMAFQNIAVGAGSLWAPFLGFYLLDSVSFQAAFFALAAACVGAALCAAAMTSAGVALQPQEAHEDEDLPLISKPALFPTFILFTHTITLAPLVAFLPAFSEQRELGNPGLFWTTYSVVSMAVMFLSGPMADRLGRVPLIVPGLALAAAAMFALLAVESLLMLVVVAAAYGIGFALLNPALQAFMFDRVPARERSAAVATNSYAWEVGESGGALALGPIAGAWGVASTFVVVGAINAGGLVTFVAHAIVAPRGRQTSQTS